MNADPTIEALALDFGPVPSARLQGPAIAWAAVFAVAAVTLFWGIRPGAFAALGGSALWSKCGYTLSLAAAALWLSCRLGKPGADCRAAIAALIIPVAAAAIAAAFALMGTPSSQWAHELLGRTWTSCSFSIVLLSAGTTPLVALAARSFAPVRLRAAGAALGLAGGALAASAYGALHCAETSLLFIVSWYSLGIAAAAAIGALCGPAWLKW